MTYHADQSASDTPLQPALLTDMQELGLLRAALSYAGNVVFCWHFDNGMLDWPESAANTLHFNAHNLPVHINDWIILALPEERERLEQIRDSAEDLSAPLDIEYTVEITKDLPQPYKLRVRHSLYPQLQGEQKKIIINFLRVVPFAPSGTSTAENLITYTDHNLPDRRSSDRRGYHYPPAFMKHMRHTIEQSVMSQTQGAFMLLAINNLSMIINGYGFDVSERILHEIKQAMAATLDEGDRVERIHRDQFGIVLAKCDKQHASEKAMQFKVLIQNLGAKSEAGAMHITCTIGSVAFPVQAATVADALDKAYVALTSQNNTAYCAFEESDHDSEQSRKQMAQASSLRDAINENRLRLAFQPIIASKDGSIAHYESLLRVVEKNGKITSAGPLIPIAEKMGMIEVIDRLVVEKVVEELRQHPTVELAFNISSMTTCNQEWVQFLAQLLNGDLAVASRMIVEITETAAQRDLRETAYFVASVQALGCKVSLDDFGSGYTSFRQLKALSVDMLKIDGAFIRDIVDNADNRFFVKTLIDFASGYGLHAVAEYVETGEIAKILMEMGVEYLQGYYFSQPLNYRPWLNEGEYTPT